MLWLSAVFHYWIADMKLGVDFRGYHIPNLLDVVDLIGSMGFEDTI